MSTPVELERANQRLWELRAAIEATDTHRPCCSAHGVHMTCAKYRRTHFVEVRPCCGIDAALLAAEATDDD